MFGSLQITSLQIMSSSCLILRQLKSFITNYGTFRSYYKLLNYLLQIAALLRRLND